MLGGWPREPSSSPGASLALAVLGLVFTMCCLGYVVVAVNRGETPRVTLVALGVVWLAVAVVHGRRWRRDRR